MTSLVSTMTKFATVVNVCSAFEEYADNMPNGNNIPGDIAIGHPDQV